MSDKKSYLRGIKRAIDIIYKSMEEFPTTCNFAEDGRYTYQARQGWVMEQLEIEILKGAEK